MNITLVGSKWFGSAALAMLREEGVKVLRVVVPTADDRLATAAKAAGIDAFVQDDPRIVPAKAIPDDTDLIVTAHSHARVANEALARARLGGIGYHPSLLPRHRGIAAIEWTIRERDPIAAQEWCFVRKGETARELWERALAPLGLNLIRKVVRYAKEHGHVPGTPQDEQFATRAPLIREPVSAD